MALISAAIMPGSSAQENPLVTRLHKRVDATSRACFLVQMYSETLGIEIVEATPADVGAVAPLFDAYRQFYKKPSNQEAARRFLFARLSKGESVLFLALHGPDAV